MYRDLGHLAGGVLFHQLQYMGQHHGVAQPVGNAVTRAQVVGDGVHIADQGLGNGQAAVVGGQRHGLARLQVVAIAAGNGQVLEHHARGSQPVKVGLRIAEAAYVGLDRVGEGVHAGGRGDRWR